MFRIKGYEHVGIRVTDREASTRFYEKLGFREERDFPEHQANEMANEAGIFINLIYNGVRRPGNSNVLQDEPEKYPGFTHAAFVVDDLDALMAALAREEIAITEGPIEIGSRRRVIFIRDPDGNVLEFNQLLA